MEILFKNTFVKTEKWVKELNKRTLLKNLLWILFHLLCFFILCWDLYKLLFLHKIDILLLLFVPIWWLFIVLMAYFKSSKVTIKRNKEIYGDNLEVISEVTNDSIKQISSNGAQIHIFYDSIKKVCLTKNYILLHSKANLLYTLSKNGFSVGNEEEFLKFLKNKGIKVK